MASDPPPSPSHNLSGTYATSYNPSTPSRLTANTTVESRHFGPTESHQEQDHPHTHPPKPSRSPNVSNTNLPRLQSPVASPSYSRQKTPIAESSNGYRPLNVKDALTYLDQVKVKFSEQPEVYNQFLDIMKEFKSQAIDTPGVIERVSSLFRGHPALISGFNTFLPPGYRIECSTDAHFRDIIKVTTPTGTTSTANGEPLSLQSTSDAVDPYYPSSSMHPHHSANNNPLSQSHHHPHHHPSPSPHYRGSNGQIPSLPTYAAPSTARQASPGSSQHNRLPPQRSHSPSTEETGTRRAPVEFNHAINYVNKIKNRFSNDPDTYKQFLEILQTYQKEQKPIQEVYAQVQILFNGANDLLAEFKQFLPDTSQPTTTNPPMDYYNTAGKGTKLKKRGMTGLMKQKRIKTQQQHLTKSGTTTPITEHMMTSDIRSNRSPIISTSHLEDGPIISLEEAEFFDRVKNYIGNKQSYYSFLRILNLFSQQVLDTNMLIDKCEPFLGGNKELFDHLKKLVNYHGHDRVIENVPHFPLFDYASCSEHGPSYRSVPKAWQNQNCSGRDALCWEVLNDDYISHPTWASEDSGFIASKKNIYEEALHRVEEERYDYDMNIEANLNTISLLEPIAKKISSMSEEEKRTFKLLPGLGGSSKTIYQRIIKKIYGKEQGTNVINMLHNNPAQTVPVILKRLKQKDEEWRKSQREWNKVWREIEIKNFYKALDYQGVLFKSSDRKEMSVKHLVTEIECLHHDAVSRRDPQFIFEFKNKKIFKDVTRVLYSYFERQTTYGHDDCEVMKAFIEMFLPVFFNVPDVLPEPDQLLQSDLLLEEEDEEVDEEEVDEEPEEDDEDNDTQNSYDSSAESSRSTRRYTRRQTGRRSPRHKPADDDHQRLLKDVLTKTMKTPIEKTAKKESFMVEQEDDDEEEEEGNGQKQHKIYNLFGNTPFYCFFRLFQICYDRLYKMKKIDRDYRYNGEKAKLMNKAALELNISSTTYHSIEMDFRAGYYKTLLKLIDRFFDDEIDQTVFEECTRYLFGNKAYTMFTIDKLMLSIMRQLHHIVTDPKAQELLSFFKKNHEHEKNTPALTQAYRLEVTEALGEDDDLYNLAFDTSQRILSIQLLAKDDKTFELADLDSYTKYIEDYTNLTIETEGIPRQKMQPQFLKRNLTMTGKREAQMESNLQYKICQNTYHMFYVIHTEDALIRPTLPSSQDTKAIDQARERAFGEWLNKGKDTSVIDEKTRLILMPRFYSTHHMTVSTAERLKALRALFNTEQQKIDAFLVPSEDAHQSEYGAECFARRQWISGFSGSAGFAVVSQKEAALFTDGRYFLQAADQLDTNWILMKQGLPGVPSWQDYLVHSLPSGSRIGLDATLTSIEDAQYLRSSLSTVNSELVPVKQNLVDLAWGKERPLAPSDKIFVHPVEFAGESHHDKLDKLRTYLREKKQYGVIVSALDEIAWLFNLRGSDVDCNPVFYAYAIITQTEATLYINPEKLTEKVHQHLEGIQLRDYDQIFDDLDQSRAAIMASEQKMILDSSTSWAIEEAIGQASVVIEERSYISDAKAIKNERELRGMRECHVRDGAAIVQYFAWLEKNLKAGQALDEVEAADYLEKCRASQPHYVGLSFPTISSTGPNGAIIHYEPERGHCQQIDPDQIYLCDSGAQYKDGTTDVTRTYHFGTPTAFQKQCFTAVLQGHIALDTAVFPKGTSGYLLDPFARMPLWKQGLDYRHGTGHGVGSFLNVHEGPHGINLRVHYNSIPLASGMTVTNEPGYYEDGQFGIRIENVLLVRKAATEHNFGQRGYLGFEHVTLVPIGLNLIEESLLSPTEKKWINEYHAECYHKLSPLIASDPDAIAWLKKETRPL
ncbi:putative Xaa-Pro aminopeptidase P [Choanephora cucurbitarum]|uniref:Putative Xaa-Pro aminopeptidase P n=1 Tax=Choanephora cucurbitarum TaxID=101091 RepID=A0A1C7N906_9FUNG|nr:putative Xaa-Pro aminopeptidase P [Choanephora cucurbitarum]